MASLEGFLADTKDAADSTAVDNSHLRATLDVEVGEERVHELAPRGIRVSRRGQCLSLFVLRRWPYGCGMRRAATLLSAFAVSGCLCNGSTISLHQPYAPMAVGSSGGLQLTRKTCTTFAFDEKGNPKSSTACKSEGVDVAEAWVDNPALFQVAPSGNGFLAKAVAAGSTTVHARPVGGVPSEVYDAQLEARTANRITVAAACDAGTPLGIVVGSRFWLQVEAHADEVKLLGLPEDPVNISVATQFVGTNQWEASSTPGLGAITSTHDSSLNIPLRVFTVSEAQLAVGPPVPNQYGPGTAFPARLTIDGRRACFDDSVRRCEVLTPEACNLGRGTDGGTQYVEDFCANCGAVAHRSGPDAGTCRLRFSVVGHSSPVVEVDHTF